MSRFKVANESVAALWERFALELESLAPSQAAADRFLGEDRINLYGMIVDFGPYAVEFVTYPAPGTGKEVLGFKVSDAFRRHATLCAKRAFKLVDH